MRHLTKSAIQTCFMLSIPACTFLFGFYLCKAADISHKGSITVEIERSPVIESSVSDIKVDYAGYHFHGKNFSWDKEGLFACSVGLSDYDIGWSVTQTSNGGFAVAGQTEQGVGYENLLLLKYDSSGNLEWAKTAGGSHGAFIGHSLTQIIDGGFAVCGYVYGYGAGLEDVLLLKYDHSGNLEWAGTAGGSSADFGYSVTQTTDGGFAVVGETYGYGAGEEDVLLLKYDGSGNLEWARTAGGSESDFGFSLTQTTDGGFAVAGRTESFSVGEEDVLLLKYDGSGNLEWARTAGGSETDIGYSLTQTTDGGYAVGGTSFSHGNPYALLLKYDRFGNLEWARTTGENYSSFGFSVTQTIDGGYAVAGGVSGYGLLLLKYDSFGNLEWARTAEESNLDVGYSLTQTTDGGYAVAGLTESCRTWCYDVLLLKTDSQGAIPDCPMIQSFSPEVSSPDISTSIIIPETSSPDIETADISPYVDSPEPSFELICSGSTTTVPLTSTPTLILTLTFTLLISGIQLRKKFRL